MKTQRLIVCGAAGRMGRKVVAAAREDARFTLAGAVVRGSDSLGLPRLASAGLVHALKHADIIIDFSSAEAAVRHAGAAARARRPIVIGVTGLSPAQRRAIQAASRRTAVFFSPNMSPGMNVLFALTRLARRSLPGYDAHIVEAHHTAKKDSPSGTSMRLAEAAGGSPISSLRVGDIVGDHTLVLAGPGEVLYLSHRATDRSVFARGALRAAAWLAGRRPGLYDFSHLLDLP